MDSDAPLDAGDFGTWFAELREALDDQHDMHVPCDDCRACCESSQFVHVAPDETETLAHIPAALLFPAPGAPPGHRLMGYDEHGRCPMLTSEGCSIYDHRPRTCRTYDCRVFAAAEIVPDGDAAAGIATRVRRWRFTVTDVQDAAHLEAVRATARRLDDEAARPDLARALSALDDPRSEVSRRRQTLTGFCRRGQDSASTRPL